MNKIHKTQLQRSHRFYCMTHSGAVSTHRLIMAEHLGRPLTSDELVFFKDGDCNNISISNLELTKDRKYMQLIQSKFRYIRAIESLTHRVSLIDKELVRYTS